MPRVLVGFRTFQGHLSTVQPFNTLELPRYVRGKPHEWNPNIALRTASAMLAFVHQTIKKDAANQNAQQTFIETLSKQASGDADLQWPVFQISFRPGQRGGAPQLSVKPLDQKVSAQERVGMLPKSWVQSMAKRKLRLQQKSAPFPTSLRRRADV